MKGYKFKNGEKINKLFKTLAQSNFEPVSCEVTTESNGNYEELKTTANVNIIFEKINKGENTKMELKDIVLKKGDVVYFKNGDKRIKLDDIDHKVGQISPEFFLINDIVKIERPVKYETIYEAPKEILDKEEKEYLEAVIRPFRKKILHIRKVSRYEHDYNEYLVFVLQNDDCVVLPYFTKNAMYQGMELDKKYTLEELGLFKEE